MTIKLRSTPSVAGVIKFAPSVSEEMLISVLRKLSVKADSRRLIDLHLRSGGDDNTHVIVFHYEMEKGTKREQRTIIERFFAIIKDVSGIRREDTRYSISTVIASV